MVVPDRFFVPNWSSTGWKAVLNHSRYLPPTWVLCRTKLFGATMTSNTLWLAHMAFSPCTVTKSTLTTVIRLNSYGLTSSGCNIKLGKSYMYNFNLQHLQSLLKLATSIMWFTSLVKTFTMYHLTLKFYKNILSIYNCKIKT